MLIFSVKHTDYEAAYAGLGFKIYCTGVVV